MTRTHAMSRLLEHGPLSYREAIDVTGWHPRAVDKVLQGLRKSRKIRRVNLEGVSKFALIERARAHAFAGGAS